MIVLDTNVLSELMRREPAREVVDWVRAQPPNLLCTTAVNVAEVRYGIRRLPRGRRRSTLHEAADEVFSTFADVILPFAATAADHYATVVVERERAGAPISGFDAQIAAICRDHSATLATRNVADFQGLGLSLVDPWRAASRH